MKTFLSLILTCAMVTTLNAQIIWNTGSLSFTKPTGVLVLDSITPQTKLTRQTVLYNAVCQTVSGFQGCSYTGPCNTEWAYGTIANWNTLTYQRLYLTNGCTPPSMVNNPLVCHLIAEDIYLQITFTQWSAGSGGAISYTRTTGPSGLPVNLQDFTAYPQKGMNFLSWKTNGEINNKGFQIERSPDGNHFEMIGFVSALQNQEAVKEYSFTDAGINNEILYYRLKQVDIDESYTYSDIRMVINEGGSDIAIYPNPARDVIHLLFPGEIKTGKVEIITATGQKVYGQDLRNTRSLLIPIDHLEKGIYFVRFTEASGKKILRFIK